MGHIMLFTLDMSEMANSLLPTLITFTFRLSDNKDTIVGSVAEEGRGGV